MKLITTFLIAFFSIIICNAQDNSKKNELMIPEIDNKFEQFDIVNFNKKKIGRELVIKNNGVLIQEISHSEGYIQRNYFDNLYFKLNKKFEMNGKLFQKGILFNNGSQYGIWYEFDEEGNLVKEIDTDAGYDFGWEQIIKYCETNEIELTKGYEKGGYQTEILKQEENGKKVWILSYLTSPVTVCRKTLDGKTGEVLEEEQLEFVNH